MAAGKAFGFFFHRRNHTSVLVREPKGDAEAEMEYEILNILEFDSTRKRMSVICRNPEGNIMLYCKVCSCGCTLSSQKSHAASPCQSYKALNS